MAVEEFNKRTSGDIFNSTKLTEGPRQGLFPINTNKPIDNELYVIDDDVDNITVPGDGTSGSTFNVQVFSNIPDAGAQNITVIGSMPGLIGDSSLVPTITEIIQVNDDETGTNNGSSHIFSLELSLSFANPQGEPVPPNTDVPFTLTFTFIDSGTRSIELMTDIT